MEAVAGKPGAAGEIIMQAALLQSKNPNRRGLLYPLLVVAAISVIIFSAIGAAALAGWLPRAESAGQAQSTQKRSDLLERQDGAPGFERVVDRRDATGPAPCTDCGVVASITPVEVKGKTNGLGMIGGGVVGALVGNQIGHGTGNTVATIGGAAGGAYAGNEVEKHFKKQVKYRVKVRMPDGTYRTTYQARRPQLAVGDHVRMSGGHISKIG